MNIKLSLNRKQSKYAYLSKKTQQHSNNRIPVDIIPHSYYPSTYLPCTSKHSTCIMSKPTDQVKKDSANHTLTRQWSNYYFFPSPYLSFTFAMMEPFILFITSKKKLHVKTNRNKPKLKNHPLPPVVALALDTSLQPSITRQNEHRQSGTVPFTETPPTTLATTKHHLYLSTLFFHDKSRSN